MMHVKNLIEENERAIIQDQHDNAETVEEYDRVYKPSYTIEFDRNGECLLYSCEPLTHVTRLWDHVLTQFRLKFTWNTHTFCTKVWFHCHSGSSMSILSIWNGIGIISILLLPIPVNFTFPIFFIEFHQNGKLTVNSLVAKSLVLQEPPIQVEKTLSP